MSARYLYSPGSSYTYRGVAEDLLGGSGSHTNPSSGAPPTLSSSSSSSSSAASPSAPVMYPPPSLGGGGGNGGRLVGGGGRAINSSSSSSTAGGGNTSTNITHMTDAYLEEDEERLFLVKLDAKCVQLQAAGRHLEAVALLEQAVASRRYVYGAHARQVTECAEKLILLYNSLAMSSLYKEDYAFSLDLLRKAEALATAAGALLPMRVQTLNNLACVYRRMQRPRTALNLLRECITLCGRAGDDGGDGHAVSHLNICAILSQLGAHEQALEHAQAAVMHCQRTLLSPQFRRRLAQQTAAQGQNSDDGNGSSSSNSNSGQHALLTEKIVILGIAYHNLGVEEEFLQHGDRCLQWYSKALQLANEHLGHTEDITNTFRESLVNAKRQCQYRERRAEQRRRDEEYARRGQRAAIGDAPPLPTAAEGLSSAVGGTNRYSSAGGAIY